MKARLYTLCGCTREVELPHPLKEVEIECLLVRPGQIMPIDSDVPTLTRVFVFVGQTTDPALQETVRHYKERPCSS